MTSCGMTYSTVVTTRQEEFKDACGEIVDASGAVLRDALVQLLRTDGSRVAETRTDGQGRFEFKDQPPQEYRLLILFGGFEPRDVVINHSGQCHVFPTIRLNLLGQHENPAEPDRADRRRSP
jgi:hypothetical protein